MFAIRGQREYTVQEDFMQAARKIKDSKKLESKLDYINRKGFKIFKNFR